MPKSDLTGLARQRQGCTGEQLHRAVESLRALPWREPLPSASPAQAQLELEVLRRLGRGDVTDGHGWRPGDDPFGLAWVTPLPDTLEVGAKPEALPDIVAALMPYAVAGEVEASGVMGLRARHTRDGVELHRLGLPGSVRLPGVSERRWRHAVAVAYYDVLDVEPAARVWQSHPRRLHPDEEATAREYAPGYAGQGRDRPDLATVASALLRRHLLFRAASATVTCINLWPQGNRIELEWYDGPDHAEVVDVLLDPVFGLPGSPERQCRCSTGVYCWAVRLRWADAPDAALNLRRGTWGWSPGRDADARKDRARRLDAMRRSREPEPR